MDCKTNEASREHHCLTGLKRIIRTIGLSLIITSYMLAAGSTAAYAAKGETVVGKVPVIGQTPQLPTGCEATSVAMLLRWAGVKVSKMQIARELPKGKLPHSRKGRLYGSNPDSEFVGDPFSRMGYGVYHKPIADVINRYLPGRADDITGTSFENVLKVIDSGRPVVVWCTRDNEPVRTSKVWYDKKGSRVVWKMPQHVVVLVGYTKTHVIVNDPWTGTRRYYPKYSFTRNWEALGRQAVTVKKPG